MPRPGREQEHTHDRKSLVGSSDPNQLLNSRIYTVEFPNGGIGEYATNVIAESLYSNADEDGFDGLLVGIISHRKFENAIPVEKGSVEYNGTRKKVITTRGWELRIRWTDGSTSWILLKELKESVRGSRIHNREQIDKRTCICMVGPTYLKKQKQKQNNIKGNIQ